MRWRHMTWTSMVQKVPFGLITPLRLARIARFAVGVTMGYFPCVHAQTSGTQTIVLQAGWKPSHACIKRSKNTNTCIGLSGFSGTRQNIQSIRICRMDHHRSYTSARNVICER